MRGQLHQINICIDAESSSLIVRAWQDFIAPRILKFSPLSSPCSGYTAMFAYMRQAHNVPLGRRRRLAPTESFGK